MDLTTVFVEEAKRAGHSTRRSRRVDQGVEIFLGKAKSMIEVGNPHQCLDSVYSAVETYMKHKMDQYLEEKEEHLNRAEEELW